MNWDIVAYILFVAAANVFGGFIIFTKKVWKNKSLNALMALSAGLLLSIAIAELIPGALSKEPSGSIYVLFGIIVIFLIQQFIVPHVHHGTQISEHGNQKSAVLGLFIGMLIHAFFEGLSIAASFKVHVHLGLSLIIALILHKLPESMTLSSIVFAVYQHKKKAVWATVFLGLSTLLGAVAGALLIFVSLENVDITSIVILFTAGIFLYVAGTDLLPIVNESKDRTVSLFFLLGILFYFVLQWGFDVLAPTHHH